MATGTCAYTAYIALEVLGLGFETCTSDCVAASATDALLALHAGGISLRMIAAAGTRPPGQMARTALAWTLVNCVWSVTGAAMWLQPSGARLGWFELLWRVNALVQAALVVVAWLMVRATLDAVGVLTTRMARVLGLIALSHGSAFALITMRSATCAFDEYVLFGGANLSPPLLSLFVILIMLVRRHQLPPSHPIFLGVAAALPFWVGNAGILCGRRSGPAAWLHRVVPAWWHWEEMATFHVCGLVGNDMLWRAFLWMATSEGTSIDGRGRGVCSGWLARLLADRTEAGGKARDGSGHARYKGH